MLNKSYHEAMRIDNYYDRFEYLKCNGRVGESIFGFARYVNQAFYQSAPWRELRSRIITRDNGNDLAHPDRPIKGRIHIHHINPVSLEQLENDDSYLFDPNNLICVDYYTHLALHYGDRSLLKEDFQPRKPGDTKLW